MNSALVEQAPRFWAKVEKTDSCWLWRGAKKETGYGTTTVRGRTVIAHRFAYEVVVGPIPEGLTIDHLCRVRLCVNPAHLEPVTMRENLLRGTNFAAVNAAKTHCPAGHPYDEVNTHRDKKGRYCRACRRIAERRRYWRKKAVSA